MSHAWREANPRFRRLHRVRPGPLLLLSRRKRKNRPHAGFDRTAVAASLWDASRALAKTHQRRASHSEATTVLRLSYKGKFPASSHSRRTRKILSPLHRTSSSPLFLSPARYSVRSGKEV